MRLQNHIAISILKSSPCYYGVQMGIRTEKLARRSYDQYCAVARGLDVIGDRWTLLLVRDLLLGPKRYKDLLRVLPGIGSNLLADRLKQLESAGPYYTTVLPPQAT